MKVGDVVKFRDGFYKDEEGARYWVIETNGDRGFLEFICDLPIPLQSVARFEELEVIEE
ncbi:MAG: hypothetical protein GX587_03470 [Bacteroidales bacterium]|nr:hypothetical protein [Bacteroidales bacterium]